MSSINVDGVSLFYTEKGAGDPVILSHGIPTDYRAWNSQLDALSPHFRVISYSRRYAYPNARQGDVTDSTVENNAADLVGLIGKLGISPIHLVGHSWGGYIAAYFAVHHSEHVRSLALVEPALVPLLLKNEKSTSEQFALLLTHPSVALSARRYLKTSNEPALKALESGENEKAVRLNLDGVQNRTGALDQFSDEQRSMMLDNARTIKEGDVPRPLVTREDLRKIKIPALVVNGETSVPWLRRLGEIAASSIPGCRRVKIAGSGHFPHVEKPSELNAQLLGFLQSQNQTTTD